MTRSGWIIFVVVVAAQFGVLAFIGLAAWDGLAASEREAVQALAQRSGSLLILGAMGLAGVQALALRFVFSRWIAPLPRLFEHARLIAMSNPRHRLPEQGPGEVRAVAHGVNRLAERFQALSEEVDGRIREANALLEEEKNTLATLMSKLIQGVLVCNPEGRILLYNPRAQRLLEGAARQSGGGDWIGLGRSVYALVDESLVRHALDTAHHRLETADANLMVPFIVSRPGGQLLSANLVPILDHERGLRGYILTFTDITRRFGQESRRGELLQSLTEGQRSAIGGIRAAIETVLTFPEMDEEGRRQFFEVIRDEALKVSGHLDRLEAEYRREMQVQLPVEDVLGSDLLAAFSRSLAEKSGLAVELSAPVEPVWLRIDAFAIIQCLVFLADQLVQWCRAREMAVILESRRALASIELRWSGAVLHMEALRAWGLRNVPTGAQGASMTLFEAIERHGGVVFPDKAPAERWCVRLVLPLADTDHDAQALTPDDAYGHDFDFHLFEQRVGARDRAGVPLTRLHATVLDTETTGLDVDDGDEIIAIGAVRIVNGRILRGERFDSFVRPTRAISEQAQAIHGISRDMLRAEPPIEDVLPRLARFVEDTVIIGHNVDFDMRFFAKLGGPVGIRFANPVLDTLLLEIALNPAQEDKSLEGIAARLGLTVTGRHTALGDALATAEIFLALIPLLAERGVTTLGDALRLCEGSAHARLTA